MKSGRSALGGKLMGELFAILKLIQPLLSLGTAIYKEDFSAKAKAQAEINRIEREILDTRSQKRKEVAAMKQRLRDKAKAKADAKAKQD
jgi:hypothetical protein